MGAQAGARNELRILCAALTGVFRRASEDFTMHREPGWIAVVAALILVSPAELFGVHMVAERFLSAWVAWPVTALTLYSLVWLQAVVRGEPDLTLVLHEPVSVRGPFGMEQRSARIALKIDDRNGFESKFPRR